MPVNVTRWLSGEARRRVSVLTTAAAVTLQPSHFTDQIRASGPPNLRPAFRFFLTCVGIILAIEAAFSFMFDTAFSDFVHHFFPVLVALAGTVSIYLFLKFLLTPNVPFLATAETTLYVGGTALFVMIISIFILLSVDFFMNYESVMTSSCRYRTIMCLVSGNSQTEYGLLDGGKSEETQGASFSYILLLILACVVYYSHVLAKVIKSSLGIARWRTYVAAIPSLFVLTPVCLGAINAVYRFLYT